MRERDCIRLACYGPAHSLAMGHQLQRCIAIVFHVARKRIYLPVHSQLDQQHRSTLL
jgi:hypothetical protein